MNVNTLNAVRAGYAFARLIRPQPLDAEPPEADHAAHAHTVDRLLGARYLAQALASQAAPTVRVVLLGVSVDLLHAASMLALAAASRRRQNAALTEAVAALAFAMAGAFAARRVQPSPTDDRSATA